VNSRLSFASSRNTCAILNVEDGAADYIRCSDVDKRALGNLFLQNATTWLDTAVQRNRIASDISIERLILVTGFYKSGNWEAAVMSSSSSSGNLSFTIGASHVNGGFLFNWNSVQHLSPDYSTGHCHPSLPPFGGGVTPVSFGRCCHVHNQRNQCIFLRGFQFRQRLLLNDHLIELNNSDESRLSLYERCRSFFMRLWPGKPSERIQSKSTMASEPLDDESSQRTFKAYDNLEPVEGFPDTNNCVSRHQVNENLVVIYIVFQDLLYNAIAIKKFMVRCSN
jgi:hypothetical protein